MEGAPLRDSAIAGDRHGLALGVPARDAQLILGHYRLAVTLEIYTHTDDEAQLDALTRLQDLFNEDEDEAEG